MKAPLLSPYRPSHWLAATLLVVASLVAGSAAAAPERIRLLLPPLSSPDQVYSRFQPLARYLSERVGIPVKPRVAGDLEALLRMAGEDRPQLAYLCPLIYSRLADTEGGLAPLVRIKRNGKSTFRTVVVVRQGSPYEGLAELKGARFAYGNPVCAASRLVPEAMFAEAGVEPGQDFFEKRTLGSNENALYSVAADLFDATAVDEASARPFLEKGVLRALQYSRPIPQYLLAANSALSTELRRRLAKALTALGRPDHNGVLDALGPDVDGFVGTRDSDYDVIRSMRRTEGAPDPVAEDPEVP